MAVQNHTLERPHRGFRATLRLGSVFTLAGVAVLAMALLQLVQTSGATTTNFSIQQLEQEELQLRTRVSQLEAQIASLASLSRIEQIAQERLGLEPPVAQESLQVNVPWLAEDRQRLPTRFAPDKELEVDDQPDASGWWQDLLKLLPFY